MPGLRGREANLGGPGRAPRIFVLNKPKKGKSTALQSIGMHSFRGLICLSIKLKKRVITMIMISTMVKVQLEKKGVKTM